MEASGQAYTEGTFRAVPDTSRCGGGNRGAGGAPYAAALNRAVRLDIHGEYNAFSHVLRGGSGAVRALVEDVFGSTLNDDEKAALLAPRLLILPKHCAYALGARRRCRRMACRSRRALAKIARRAAGSRTIDEVRALA